MQANTSEKNSPHSGLAGMNLNAGDISALDWIDCNNGCEEEDDEINLRGYQTNYNSRQDLTVIAAPFDSDKNKFIEIVETRERGDGDSGEEIQIENDSRYSIENISRRSSKASSVSKTSDNMSITPPKTVLEQFSSDEDNDFGLKSSPRTFTIDGGQKDDVPDDLKSIMSGISSLEMDEDENLKDENDNSTDDQQKIVALSDRSKFSIENLKKTLLDTLLSIAMEIPHENCDCICEEEKHLSKEQIEKIAQEQLNSLLKYLRPKCETLNEIADIHEDFHSLNNATVFSSFDDNSLSVRAPMAIAEDYNDEDDAADDAQGNELNSLEERILEAPAGFRGTDDEDTSTNSAWKKQTNDNASERCEKILCLLNMQEMKNNVNDMKDNKKGISYFINMEDIKKRKTVLNNSEPLFCLSSKLIKNVTFGNSKNNLIDFNDCKTIQQFDESNDSKLPKLNDDNLREDTSMQIISNVESRQEGMSETNLHVNLQELGGKEWRANGCSSAVNHDHNNTFLPQEMGSSTIVTSDEHSSLALSKGAPFKPDDIAVQTSVFDEENFSLDLQDKLRNENNRCDTDNNENVDIHSTRPSIDNQVGEESKDNDQIDITQCDTSLVHKHMSQSQQTVTNSTNANSNGIINPTCKKCGFDGRSGAKSSRRQLKSTLKQIKKHNYDDYNEIKRSLERLIEASLINKMDCGNPFFPENNNMTYNPTYGITLNNVTVKDHSHATVAEHNVLADVSLHNEKEIRAEEDICSVECFDINPETIILCASRNKNKNNITTTTNWQIVSPQDSSVFKSERFNHSQWSSYKDDGSFSNPCEDVLNKSELKRNECTSTVLNKSNGKVLLNNNYYDFNFKSEGKLHKDCDDDLISGKEVVIGSVITKSHGGKKGQSICDSSVNEDEVWSRNNVMVEELELEQELEQAQCRTRSSAVETLIENNTRTDDVVTAITTTPAITSAAADAYDAPAHSSRTADVATLLLPDASRPHVCGVLTTSPHQTPSAYTLHNFSEKPVSEPKGKNDGDQGKYVWKFSNGRLVFQKLEELETNEKVEEKSKVVDHAVETESCEPRQDSTRDSVDVPLPINDTETNTLFDVIERYADRIESEIVKCSSESNKLLNNNAQTTTNESDDIEIEVLKSRDLNKGVFEGRSRLKRLECKLKEAAGVLDESDVISQFTCDANKIEVSAASDNDTFINNDENKTNPVVIEEKNVEQSANDSLLQGYCEFDVNKVADFVSSDYYTDSDFYVVYDELEDDENNRDETLSPSSSAASSTSGEEEHYHLISCANLTAATMRGGSSNEMGGSDVGSGSDPQRKRHNPDHDNLKSLLKKPSSRSGGNRGSTSESGAKKNRVVFNEKRNEFFDADYIILIREECDYDEEDDDGVCTCNQHEMVRLTCCEPNCNCNYDGGYEQTPPSPKFAPPLEFVDAVTLSPPEGYKDMDLGELAALQQLARQRAAAAAAQHQLQQQLGGAVCRDCSSAQHQRHLDHDSDSAHSDNEEEDIEEESGVRGDEDGGDISGSTYQGRSSAGGEISKTDQSQQTTPTTPTTPLSEEAQQRYIMETITMATVTERRILHEADGETASPVTSGNEEHSSKPLIPTNTGSPISGILKGGRLWNKQQQFAQQSNGDNQKSVEPPITARTQVIETTFSADSDEVTNRRSVRFCDSDEEKRNSCDGEVSATNMNEDDNMENRKQVDDSLDNQNQDLHHLHSHSSSVGETDNCNNSISPDGTEMLLTFKLGNHLLISNNSLRPNSAVRQLFPCANALIPKDETDNTNGQQYIVTSESLRAFEESKRSKLLPQYDSSGDDNTIKRTIERNTLRRSLIRYEPRTKKTPPKNDNSLVERIKQLTCDVDDNPPEENEQQTLEDENISQRTSPPGEESRKVSTDVHVLNNKNIDKNSFSPSSSSTTSSNSSMSSTYKKITDLFGKKQGDKVTTATTHSQAETQTMNDVNNRHTLQTGNISVGTAPPDLGIGTGIKPQNEFVDPQSAVSKYNVTHEARKQFLSTLAPLTACVSGAILHDEYYYQLSTGGQPGERSSVASTAGTEYSLEDIDAVLTTENNEEPKRVAPDVLAGTPSASESGDELAMFVQQDAGRIERIKKRYQPETVANNDEDDEHDDYGFNRRPSVRGIKPRFVSTTEIIQQNQLQPQNQSRPSSQISWPYYSETTDNKNSRPMQAMNSRINKDDSGSEYSLQMHDPKYMAAYGSQTFHYTQDGRAYTMRGPPPPYRPNSLVEESLYQNCTNQRCTQQHYTLAHHAPIMRIGGTACAELYQTLPNPTRRNSRPESPPPMEVARNYQQTMVLIPYNRIEGYHSTGSLSPNPLYSDYARVPQANKMNPHIIRQQTDPSNPNSVVKIGPKQMIRVPYASGQPVQVHLMASSRSESPQLAGQFATARATQTSSVPPNPNYFPPASSRYRPAIGAINSNIWHNPEPTYVSKMGRQSYSTIIRPTNDLTNVDMNGYRNSGNSEGHYAVPRDSTPASPTKSSRFAERGVPEGAASVSPQDSYQSPPTSTTGSVNAILSPTNPQIPPSSQSSTTNTKPMYYAMNV